LGNSIAESEKSMRMITLRKYSSYSGGKEQRINIDEIQRYEDCEYGVTMWFKGGGNELFFGTASGIDKLITEAQRQ
jgi:hypothetical protein